MTERSQIDRAIRAGKAEMGRIESDARQRLTARYVSAWDRIEAELRFVVLSMEAQSPGAWFDPDGRLTRYGELAFREQRLRSLLSLIEAEYARSATGALTDIDAARQRAAVNGMETVRAMRIDASPEAALNVSAYERVIAATLPVSPLRAVLDRYQKAAGNAIERHLIEGMIQGKGIEAIVIAIQGEIGHGVPAWKLAQISRMESMRAFRGSLRESYQAIGINQVQWTATLSPRTCKACLSRHGQLFPADFVMDSHPGCRCVMTPYTGTDQRMTGDEWFRRQPVEWQRQQLGKAYELYASKRITLSAFAQRRPSQLWGPTVSERSIADVVRRAA